MKLYKAISEHIESGDIDCEEFYLFDPSEPDYQFYVMPVVLESVRNSQKKNVLKLPRQRITFECCETMSLIDGEYQCRKCGRAEAVNLYSLKRETKEYCTAVHCQVWLNHLQGKDLNLKCEILPTLIERARKKCTVNGNFSRSLIQTLKCADIREWLKFYRQTRFNKHVPTIHRVITRELGCEIIPPQFSSDEEKIIIDYWNSIADHYCEVYNELKKCSKIKVNHPSYGHLLANIVIYLFNDLRAERLRDYIHKNSVETMDLREKCWDVVKGG